MSAKFGISYVQDIDKQALSTFVKKGIGNCKLSIEEGRSS